MSKKTKPSAHKTALKKQKVSRAKRSRNKSQKNLNVASRISKASKSKKRLIEIAKSVNVRRNNKPANPINKIREAINTPFYRRSY